MHSEWKLNDICEEGAYSLRGSQRSLELEPPPLHIRAIQHKRYKPKRVRKRLVQNPIRIKLFPRCVSARRKASRLPFVAHDITHEELGSFRHLRACENGGGLWPSDVVVFSGQFS